MNSPELLRRDELIEQASLDALGLLDEFEAEHYAKSFQAASPSVQEEIRNLQAAIASDESLLGDEMPPAGLRGRVLGAVQDAIEDEARELQPIASIGSKVRRTIVRAGASTSTHQIAGEIQTAYQDSQVRTLHRTVSVWRAASVALAASLIVSLCWVIVIAKEALLVSQLAQNSSTKQELIDRLGTSFETFLSAPSKVRALAPIIATQRVAAVLMTDEKSGDGYLAAFGLQMNMVYTVRMVATDGSTTNLGQMVGGLKVTATALSRVDPTKLLFDRIEVLDSNGQIVLQTAQI